VRLGKWLHAAAGTAGWWADWLPGKTFVRKTGRAAADTLNFIFQIVPLKISHLIVVYT